MIPKTQTFDNSKKGLLNASRGMKEPQRPKKYRRGGVANSGASLQPKRPDPNAGRQQHDDAKFLGQMQELIYGKGMIQDQYQQAERDKGIATWEKASVEQRENYEKAIKSGWINSKESPYFRESITNAYTDNLVHKASLTMWTDYEKWPDKNNPNSGNLEKFFQQQEEAIAINLESIPDETLKNRFYEQWQAQKRELTRKHGNYLNAEYNAKAQDEVDNLIYNKLEQYDSILDKDYRNTNSSLSQMLDGQRYTRDNYREIGRLLETIGSDGRIPDKELENLKYKAVSRGGVYLEMYEDLTGNTDARIVEALPSKETEISSQDIEVIAEVIAPIKNRETKIEVEEYLEELSTHTPLEFVHIPVSPRETAAKQIEFQKIIAKKPTVGESVVNAMIQPTTEKGRLEMVFDRKESTKMKPGDTASSYLVRLLAQGNSLDKGSNTRTLVESWTGTSEWDKYKDGKVKDLNTLVKSNPKLAALKSHFQEYLIENYGKNKDVPYPVYDSKKGFFSPKGRHSWKNAKFNLEDFMEWVDKREGSKT
jgi:hypothetical protein